MAMVVVEVRGWWKFPRWKAFLPSCPATSLCARATRVLGLRRPRITFGARGSDGALVAGTSVHGSSLLIWAAVVPANLAVPRNDSDVRRKWIIAIQDS